MFNQQNAIGAYIFVIFASVLFINAIFFYIYVPETNNVTFGETTEYFRRRSLGLSPEDEGEIKTIRQSFLQTKSGETQV